MKILKEFGKAAGVIPSNQKSLLQMGFERLVPRRKKNRDAPAPESRQPIVVNQRGFVDYTDKQPKPLELVMDPELINLARIAAIDGNEYQPDSGMQLINRLHFSEAYSELTLMSDPANGPIDIEQVQYKYWGTQISRAASNDGLIVESGTRNESSSRIIRLEYWAPYGDSLEADVVCFANFRAIFTNTSLNMPDNHLELGFAFKGDLCRLEIFSDGFISPNSRSRMPIILPDGFVMDFNWKTGQKS